MSTSLLHARLPTSSLARPFPIETSYTTSKIKKLGEQDAQRACATGMRNGHAQRACATGMRNGHAQRAYATGMRNGHAQQACATGMCMHAISHSVGVGPKNSC